MMRMIPVVGLLLLGSAALLLPAGAGPGPAPDAITLPPLHPPIPVAGEELIYEVRWGLIGLGTVRIRGTGTHAARAWIDSYENLPFVDLHSIYSTVMDSLFFSRGAMTMDKGAEGWDGYRYRVDSVTGRVLVDHVFSRQPAMTPERAVIHDTVDPGSPRFVDGLSIGYLPRLFLRTKQKVAVPTLLGAQVGLTTFTFDGKRTLADIDAVERPVRVVEVRGTTTAEGIYGMTGDFVGWFSDDVAAVPVKGRLKVLIGSVTVELVQWKGTGWSPPLAGG